MVWLSITARNSGHNRVDSCKVLSYWESKCGKNCNRLRFIEKVLITVQAEYLWSEAKAAQKCYRIYQALFKLNIYLALSFLFLIMQQNIIFWFIMKLLSFHPLSPLSHFSRSPGSLRKEIVVLIGSVMHMPEGAAKWAFCIFSEVTKGWRDRGLWILLTSCPLETLVPCAPSPLSPMWKQELCPPIATIGRVDTLVWN